MVPTTAGRGSVAAVVCKRQHSKPTLELGSFGTPFRAPGPPVICRNGCGRQGWRQDDRRCDLCCELCDGGSHNTSCDGRNGVHPPDPIPDYDPDNNDPGYHTDSDDSVDIDALDALAVGGPEEVKRVEADAVVRYSTMHMARLQADRRRLLSVTEDYG